MFTISQIVQNIFRKNILRYYLVIVVVIIAACYFIGKKVQMPYFFNNIIKTVVFENQKIAAHTLTHNCLNNTEITLTDELNMLKENFNLVKIKFFDSSGTVIASTDDKDIGEQNQEAYFKNNIKNQEPFFKNIPKGTKSFEQEAFNYDVLEIYYPLYLNNEFIGVIEIYYNISRNLVEFNDIITQIDSMFIIIVIIFFVIFFFILYRLSLSDLNREKNEHEIENLNKTLQKKVKKRTLELQEKNKQLRKLANFDSLTGVYNRGFFLNMASKYYDIAKRQETSLYVISFDLDYFKRINDTYGHAMGDLVLKKFSQMINEKMRKSDIFGRVGGEEFMACIQNMNDEGIMIFAQKIKDNIEKMEISYHQEIFKVTVSIGVSKLQDEGCLETLIEKSDKALYEAKRSGRNRICFAY